MTCFEDTRTVPRLRDLGIDLPTDDKQTPDEQHDGDGEQELEGGQERAR